jgi:type II secretory pathway component GspD/PulD (secretin)
MVLPDLSTFVLLASLFLGLAAPPQDAAQEAPPVRMVDDGRLVELDLDDVTLESFLMASQAVLGEALQWDNGEVANTRLNQPGLQRCARTEFRDVFDAVLERYGLLTWDDPTAPAPVISVFRPFRDRAGNRQLPFAPPVLAPEDLDAAPAERAPLYATVFTLQHASAADLVAALKPLLDLQADSVEAVARTNQLLVVAARSRLLSVRDALRRLDVASPGAPALGERLEALERRVSELEARLAKLEAAR